MSTGIGLAAPFAPKRQEFSQTTKKLVASGSTDHDVDKVRVDAVLLAIGASCPAPVPLVILTIELA
jgi:hypothetical protein